MTWKCTQIEINRFWDNVGITGNDDECWEWMATRNRNGYGCFYIGGKSRLSHRIAFELVYGRIYDPDICVTHSCDNRRCCRPDHLFAAMKQDNNQDMVSRSRNARGEILAAPKRGEGNPHHKLEEWEVREIKIAFKKPYRGLNRDLCRRYGVTHTIICNITSERTWSHVKV